MLSRRQRRRRMERMRREGRTCRDFERECDMQVEHTMVHYGLDGRTFHVRRLACTCCGRQVTTARQDTGSGDVESNF